MYKGSIWGGKGVCLLEAERLVLQKLPGLLEFTESCREDSKQVQRVYDVPDKVHENISIVYQ